MLNGQIAKRKIDAKHDKGKISKVTMADASLEVNCQNKVREMNVIVVRIMAIA
jgi:hypothetical protein